jgi:plastocyanin
MKKIPAYFGPAAVAAVCLAAFGVGSHAVAAAAAGSLTGAVKLDGPAPKRAPISMAKEPVCAAMHSSAALTEDIVTDSAGNLENVVVYISSGLQNPDPTPPQEPAVITQDGCSYKPHVIALQANQKLRIVNVDKTSHNIHPMPDANREWNKSQPPDAPAVEESFAREEVGIPVKCNVHPWMRAYISVFRHPYFSVTNPSGAFSIKNLPPGTYTVSAWHEKLGTQSQKVTVSAGEAKIVQFAFKMR